MAKHKRIGMGEHVYIAGMTGTGKTYFAKTYLAEFPTVGVLDTKGEAMLDIAEGRDPWPQVAKEELTVFESLDDLDKVDTPYYIYSPKLDELSEHYYNEFFKYHYFKLDCTVLVDEAMQVSPNGNSIPWWYRGILTRGRSRRVSVWSCTQRPANVSQDIIAQSSHVVMFNLRKHDDRKRISDSTGMPEFMTNPGGHNFWYWEDGMTEAVKARLKA